MTTRDQLYAKFGIAAEAAQLFETELGTIILGSRAIQEGWHIIPEADIARAELDVINASTLGQALGKLKAVVQLDDEIINRFASALKARNDLTHGFFLKHGIDVQTEQGRGKMVVELEELHTEIFNAWMQASAISDALMQLIEKLKSPH